MIVLIPFLAALIGVLMYALSSNPKVQELGRIIFFCGFFVTLLRSGSEVVTLFK